MSDLTTNAVSAIDATDWAARQTAMDALDASVRPANKAALFDALADAGITSVVVTFDGYGDSGQIEEIDARAGDRAIDLPVGTIDIAIPRWGEPDPERRAIGVAEAIEMLAYDFLRSVAAGWENNDGAYGDFIFDVAERTITLEYNERLMRSESYEYAF